MVAAPVDWKEKIAELWAQVMGTRTWAAGAALPLTTVMGRMTRLLMTDFEQQVNLSSSQMRVLMSALMPEGVSQSDLHRFYKIDPAAITRTVQMMERDGLVTRRPDTADNRLMRVYVTDKGRTLAEALPDQIAAFEQKATAGMSNDDILTLHRLLAQIETNLENLARNRSEI